MKLLRVLLGQLTFQMQKKDELPAMLCTVYALYGYALYTVQKLYKTI